MTIPKRKAFSYVRMSTPQQLQGDSQRRQAEQSEAYAKARGWDLVKTLEDLGVSGFKGANLQKGALGTFMEAARKGHIPDGSVLIIESLDRLTRTEVLSAFTLLINIVELGISIVTLDTNTEYTKESLNKDFGQLMMTLGDMFRANQESELKSTRQRAAWQNKRKNAATKKLSSIRPAWLDISNDRSQFIPITSRANTIREIFRRSADGFGAGAITNWLNENSATHPPFSVGVSSVRTSSNAPLTRARGTRWQKSYVQKILNNPAVYGEFQPHIKVDDRRVPEGEPIPNYYPEIVTKDEFLLSQARMRARKVSGAGRKGSIFSNLFTRMAQCGSCGGSIGFKNKGKPPKGGSYLRCTNADARHECVAPAWRYDEFENSFLQWISEVGLAEILSPSSVDVERSKLRDEQSVIEHKLKEAREIYQNLLDRLGKVPSSAVDDVVAEIDKRSAEVAGLEQQLAEIEQKLTALSDQDPIKAQKHLVQSIDRLSRSLNDIERKELRARMHNQIKKMVEVIIIHNSDQFFSGDSAEEIVPYYLINKAMVEEGLSDEPAVLDAFFAGPKGKLLFHKFHRHYNVRFKDGTVKTVYPDRKTAIWSVSSKMAKLIKTGAKNNQSRSVGRNLAIK